MLEELGMPYTVKPINILEGDQFDPAYLEKNPNNKIPTIVDPCGPDGTPFTVFESGAILLYLGEKAGGRFLGGAAGSAGRHRVTQWLMFQMASIGPMFGQNGYWQAYARGTEEELRHGRERYKAEAERLYRVMDKRLAASPFLGGESYSVADMAVLPWIQPELHGIELERYAHVHAWHQRLHLRPAVQQGFGLLRAQMKVGDRSDTTHRNLFQRQKLVGTTPDHRPPPDPERATDQDEEGQAEEEEEEVGGELWYTPIENHVHCVEVVAQLCGLESRLRLIPTDPFQVDPEKGRYGFETLGGVNPLLTVPALRTPQGEALYGGPVVYEYLNLKRRKGCLDLVPAGGARGLAARKTLWLADALFDAFVALLLETHLPTHQQRPAAVARGWLKVEGGLDALEALAPRWLPPAHPLAAPPPSSSSSAAAAAAAASALDIGQVRAACALDFMHPRLPAVAAAAHKAGFSWREGRPALGAWYDALRLQHAHAFRPLAPPPPP